MFCYRQTSKHQDQEMFIAAQAGGEFVMTYEHKSNWLFGFLLL